MKKVEILFIRISLQKRRMPLPSFKNHMVDLYQKLLTPIHIIFYLLLITAITYVGQIPPQYKHYGNNIFVRAMLFGFIVLVNNYISYLHALLFAIFVLLYVSYTPGFIERFENLRIVARNERRWWDETVLGEDPELVETERVHTQAVQSG